MITITINIPDNKKTILTDIENLVNSAGGYITVNSDQDKTELKKALHEAFDIVDGKTPRRTIRDVLNG